MELRFVTTGDPLYRAELELRHRVLREPLGLAPSEVAFPFEAESLHLVAVEGLRVVGCVMFHPESAASGRLLQMAVAADRRGAGIGRALARALDAELRRRGVREVHLHARESAVGFYEKLGYAVLGEPFVEVSLPHRHMRREL